MQIKNFYDLNLDQLYAILKLRTDVFVVEQQCPYDECDNQDQKAVHFLVEENDGLIGYCRVLFVDEHLHIGRIVVAKNYRNQGIASSLLLRAMDYCKDYWPNEDIYLSAQLYLKEYYERFGFDPISEVYDWDGIDHIDMKMSVT